MNLLSLIFGQWQRLLIYGAVVIAALAVAAGWGYMKGSERLYRYQAKQATEAVKIIVKQGEITEVVVREYIKVAGKTRVITETIEKETIRYVEAALDRCPLSRAAISLHDAAASNAVPDPARSTDGAASGLTTAALTETCISNYTTYHREADKLRGLQAWIRAQQAVKP